tara:strand:+ start:286 stop:561 length:276 start_codon:yes stop_codon:yes gene_type:complete
MGMSVEEIIDRIKPKFKIKPPRLIERIDLNIVTQEAILKVLFIGYELAYEIIEMRLLKEAYMLVCELTKLKDFPIEKIDTNKLYLYIKHNQ